MTRHWAQNIAPPGLQPAQQQESDPLKAGGVAKVLECCRAAAKSWIRSPLNGGRTWVRGGKGRDPSVWKHLPADRAACYALFARKRGALFLLLALLVAVPRALAQETAREMLYQGPVAMSEWTNPPAFQKDVFTFVRIKYSVSGRYGYGHTEDRWAIDAPDSDLNFSFRLQQMTSMKVNPDGRVLEITDKELFDYPFIYIVEPGRLTFTDREVPILRRYLLNGGFLMVDDFWGDREWNNFHQEIKRVFPDREPQELEIDHPIFHCVFDLKEKPQIPGIAWFVRYGMRYEARRGENCETPHYRAIFDDKGRIMVMICHNTDLGDGWEREGENVEYFQQFSEKQAYPMGINIVYWAMTH